MTRKHKIFGGDLRCFYNEKLKGNNCSICVWALARRAVLRHTKPPGRVDYVAPPTVCHIKMRYSFKCLTQGHNQRTRQLFFYIIFSCWAPSREAVNTIFKCFGTNRHGNWTKVYRLQCGCSSHYTPASVHRKSLIQRKEKWIWKVRETVGDCKYRMQRIWSEWFICRVVVRKKWMTEDTLQSDNAEGKRADGSY